jgi:hypothetical protein
MPEPDSASPPALDIDWLKTTAGALAAVTSAVLLSTLGAVGTLIGAALGSVAATIGSALYAQGLARSRYAVLKAQETALHKVGIAQAEVRRAGRFEGDVQEAHLDLADERLGEAKEELDEAAAAEPAPLSWGERIALLPWRRVAVIAAGTFVVVVLAITAFETLTGESVSQRTGGSDQQGTTLGGVTGNSGDNGKPDKPQHSQEPSGSPSPSETSEDTPSETPTPTPTETPTEAATASETPTATTTASPADPPSASATP